MPQGQDGDERRDNRDAKPEDRRARVGQLLRKAYDDALAEEVPDSFADLLRKLE